MKAKDYAEKYKANPVPQVVGEIAVAILIEVADIIKIRHAQSSEAMISILNEMIDKWRAFAKLTGDETIRPDGLKRFIIKDFPFIPEDQLK